MTRHRALAASSRRRSGGGGGSASITAVTTVGNSGSATTSVTITAPTSPVAGNLLVIVHYSPTDPTSFTVPSGFTLVGKSTGTSAGAAIYAKVATGSEGTTFAVGGASGFHAGTFMERDSSTGWLATPWQAFGSVNAASAETATITSGSATTQAQTLAVAGVGTSNTVTFNDTWTGGFVTTGFDVASRLNTATKVTAAIETPSTTETWVTARISRGVIAAFRTA